MSVTGQESFQASDWTCFWVAGSNALTLLTSGGAKLKCRVLLLQCDLQKKRHLFILLFFSFFFIFLPIKFLEREPFPTCRWPPCIAPGANWVAGEGNPLYKRLSEGIGAEGRRLI